MFCPLRPVFPPSALPRLLLLRLVSGHDDILFAEKTGGLHTGILHAVGGMHRIARDIFAVHPAQRTLRRSGRVGVSDEPPQFGDGILPLQHLLTDLLAGIDGSLLQRGLDVSNITTQGPDVMKSTSRLKNSRPRCMA